VDLPEGKEHGTPYAHRRRGCRCARCQAWRRAYDKGRNREIRDGARKVREQGHWYVCANRWGATFAEHEYNRWGTCLRCGTDRKTEEFWERRWQEAKP
jgi:hypothetical protein